MTRRKWLLLPLLLCAVAAVYYPAWRGGLLWDDPAHITDPALRSLHGLWRIWTDLGATQQYYPLAHSAFWMQHRLWGESLLGYHLVNIALHATSAFIIALILWRLAIPGAVIAAVLFAVHPIHVESVAWISELKNTLSTLLYLAAALAYLRFDEDRSRKYYGFAFAFFVCALLTKTVTATLPAALLVVFWWRRRELSLKRDVAPLIPFFISGIAAGLLTAWVERHMIGAQGADFDLSAIERILIAGRAVWFYLGKIVWPNRLIFIYPRWDLSAGELWQLAFPVALIGALLGLWLWRHRSRAPLAIALLFCGALFPALGFVDVYPFRFSFVADHFAYLASVPIFAAIAAALARLKPRVLPPLAITVALLLGALTWRQSANYASAEVLYRATIAENPEAWMAHNNLGTILVDDGRNDEARAHFVEAVRLNPNVAEHYMNLGRLLVAEGALPAAAAELREALRLDPAYADARSNLGVALLRLDSADAAIVELEEALRIEPDHAEARETIAAAHISSGIAHARGGRFADAARHFGVAVQYRPADAALRYNYGTALLALGRARDAVPELEEALRLAPDLAEAHANLESAKASLN